MYSLSMSNVTLMYIIHGKKTAGKGGEILPVCS